MTKKFPIIQENWKKCEKMRRKGKKKKNEKKEIILNPHFIIPINSHF